MVWPGACGAGVWLVAAGTHAWRPCTALGCLPAGSRLWARPRPCDWLSGCVHMLATLVPPPPSLLPAVWQGHTMMTRTRGGRRARGAAPSRSALASRTRSTSRSSQRRSECWQVPCCVAALRGPACGAAAHWGHPCRVPQAAAQPGDHPGSRAPPLYFTSAVFLKLAVPHNNLASSTAELQAASPCRPAALPLLPCSWPPSPSCCAPWLPAQGQEGAHAGAAGGEEAQEEGGVCRVVTPHGSRREGTGRHRGARGCHVSTLTQPPAFTHGLLAVLLRTSALIPAACVPSDPPCVHALLPTRASLPLLCQGDCQKGGQRKCCNRAASRACSSPG